MRLSCVCIRVGQHTTRPEMKAPGSEDDVRLKRPYGEKYNKVSFRFFFLENLNSLHAVLIRKKKKLGVMQVFYKFLSHHPMIRDFVLRIKRLAFKFSLFRKWNKDKES